MKKFLFITIALLLVAIPVKASELSTLAAAIDAVDNFVDTEIATIDAVVDTINLKVEYAEYMLENIQGIPATSSFFLSQTVDHSDPAWDDVATNEVFDVTGYIEFWLMVYDSVNVVCTNATDSLRFLVGTSLVWSCLGDGFDAGELVPFGTASAAGPVLTTAVSNVVNGNGGCIYHGISLGLDIGYEHVTAVAVTGVTRWLIWWKPLSASGTVAAGAGGTL